MLLGHATREVTVTDHEGGPGAGRPGGAPPPSWTRLPWWAFNQGVPESWDVGNRVFIEDARRDGTYLRVTWHTDARQFVVSHWQDDVCTAATRIPVSAAPGLVNLLVEGLGQTVGRRDDAPRRHTA